MCVIYIYSIPLVMCHFLCQCHAGFITMALQYNLKFSVVIISSLTLSVQEFFSYSGPFALPPGFGESLSSSVKSIIEILMKNN